MAVTYRTLGPWGPGKGANLQPSEVDNNFWSMAQAIVDLQSNPALPNGISTITVSGTQMTITLSDGTVLGPFPLPVVAFHWRGDWLASSPYFELDVFSVPNTGIFLVTQPHTSGATFDPNIEVGGAPALQQLFGSTDASLGGLSDVQLTMPIANRDTIRWNATTGFWQNENLGTMADQNASSVAITGGTITGMPTPVYPTDVATKAYADTAAGEGSNAPALTLLANTTSLTAAMQPHTLSDWLDAALATTVRGCIIFRSGTGWIALQPGMMGQFLQTGGPGVDPQWSTGVTGVAAIYAGTGIYVGSLGVITGTGTVALAALPDGDFLANISGASAAPVPVTLAQFLDHVLGTARGTLITRTSVGWVGLAPGTAGQFLQTQGAGADLIWGVPAGSGTVTSIAAGTGISTGGAPITGTGTVSLATIADGMMLANASGATAAPIPTALSALWDHVLSATQGAVLYRSATTWSALAPGTSGQILTTGGAAANPSWQNAPITGASTANLRIISNISGSTAVPTGNTLSNIFDAILGSSRGLIVYRTNSGWAALAPGTAGNVLTTGGSAADPTWTAPAAATFAGLTDVNFSTLSDNDLAVYNLSAAHWQNHQLTTLLDAVLGSAQGSVAYRGAGSWVSLAPGTVGQLLRTGGPGSNPAWATVTGTIPAISDSQIVSNITGVAGMPSGNTLTAILDYILGTTPGSVLYRGATAWTARAPGRSSYYGMAAPDASWQPFGGNKWHQPASVATTGPIAGTMTLGSTGGTIGGTTFTCSANGPITIDGKVLDGIAPDFGVGVRVLFKDQANGAQNLIWVLTTIGTSTTPSVFTAATDFDDTNYFGGGDIVPVGSGTVNTGQIFMSQVGASFVLGTSIIGWIVCGGISAVARKYNLGCYVPALLTASQNLLFHKFSKAVTVPSNFGAFQGHISEAGAGTAATASTVVNVAKAVAATPTTFSNVGTITFAAAGASATLATTGGTAISFAQGDVLRLQAPATADATLADFYATLVGYET